MISMKRNNYKKKIEINNEKKRFICLFLLLRHVQKNGVSLNYTVKRILLCIVLEKSSSNFTSTVNSINGFALFDGDF